MSHEITDTISKRENSEIRIENPDRNTDYPTEYEKLAWNTEKYDALFLEVQGFNKQNKEPQDMPDIHQVNEDIWPDEEKALMAKNERIKEHEAVEV